MNNDLSLKTNWASFDELTAGGFPRGRITEIYGEKGSGKTQMLMRAARECGGSVALISLDRGVHRSTRLPLAAIKVGRAILRGCDLVILDGIQEALPDMNWANLSVYIQKRGTALVFLTRVEGDGVENHPIGKMIKFYSSLRLRCTRDASGPLTCHVVKSTIAPNQGHSRILDF